MVYTGVAGVHCSVTGVIGAKGRQGASEVSHVNERNLWLVLPGDEDRGKFPAHSLVMRVMLVMWSGDEDERDNEKDDDDEDEGRGARGVANGNERNWRWWW